MSRPRSTRDALVSQAAALRSRLSRSDVSTRRVPTEDGGELVLDSFGAQDAVGARRIAVVCGAFLPAVVYAPFARSLVRELPDGWAVDVYDRRGKGRSSPIPSDYSLETEIGDLAAILNATGAVHVFGHSLGGSVVLNAVQALAGGDPDHLRFVGTAPVPATMTLYDPAVNIDGQERPEWVKDFTEAADAGHVWRSLAVVQRGMSGSTPLSKAPPWMVAAVMAMGLRNGLSKVTSNLYPAGAAELVAALGEKAKPGDFARLPVTAHFVTGERSAPYFHATTLRLSVDTPGSTLQMVRGGVHGSVPAANRELVKALARWYAVRGRRAADAAAASRSA